MADKKLPVSGYELYLFLGQELGLKARDKLYKLYQGHRISYCRLESLARNIRNKQIRERYNNGVPIKDLSWEFGLSESGLYKIIKGNK